jgi:NADPH:quinone reductase-like Zn-dependent oxidoreductase
MQNGIRGEMMACIVRFREYGDASVLKIQSLDVPRPAADEVQIDVKSIGLNRAEVMFRTHAYMQEAQFPSRLEFEAAGIVTKGWYIPRQLQERRCCQFDSANRC